MRAAAITIYIVLSSLTQAFSQIPPTSQRSAHPAAGPSSTPGDAHPAAGPSTTPGDAHPAPSPTAATPHGATRFDELGNALDAHDGEIALFNNTYYLYGTSYGCGFEWGNKQAPFCGFRSYSSKDMLHWTDNGPLFDAKTPVWQTRCDGSTYGCFRPHVIYNKKTRQYVLWINVYDNISGYRVFTSPTPTGPFLEAPQPVLAVNTNAPAKGLNNGDHDTFVDDDGTAWLAFTDWRQNGAIAIEQLSDDYLTGSGKVITKVTDSMTEAPGLFKRNGLYYLLYSDPNCGYCSGTGTSYKTAKNLLGPWSQGKKISDNSCGGQPSFVSTLHLNTGNIYLYGSDLWNNAAKNEALANYFWTALSFAPDGSINPITCEEKHPINRNKPDTISDSQPYTQTIKAKKTGTLQSIKLCLYQTGHPDNDLQITLYEGNRSTKTRTKILPAPQTKASISPQPSSSLKVIYTQSIPEKEISWSPTIIDIPIKKAVRKGAAYTLTLTTTTKRGQYTLIPNPLGPGTTFAYQ